ncbi:MAG: nucleoside hydrolase [Verrucomicrobiota bacterium]
MQKRFAFAAFIAVGCRVGAATIWIDTDVSIGSPIREVDDAFALVVAFHSPEIHIAGISTTYGNAPLAYTTRKAQFLVQNFGRPAGLTVAQVFPGAESARDLGRGTSASEAFARELRKQNVTYVALGPLTNLATFLQLHPEMTKRIERVIFVGGKERGDNLGLGPNHSFRIHDANVFKDPAAVKVVLRSSIPIFLTPIRTSAGLMIDGEDRRGLRQDGPAATYLSHHSTAWLWFWRHVAGTNGGPIFDALAIISVTRPELISVKRRYAQLDRSGDLVVSSSLTNGRLVRYYDSFDPKAKAFVLGRLTAPRWKDESAPPVR